jgi:hypothetical protein
MGSAISSVQFLTQLPQFPANEVVPDKTAVEAGEGVRRKSHPVKTAAGKKRVPVNASAAVGEVSAFARRTGALIWLDVHDSPTMSASGVAGN